jgi:hypothetical protein
VELRQVGVIKNGEKEMNNSLDERSKQLGIEVSECLEKIIEDCISEGYQKESLSIAVNRPDNGWSIFYIKIKARISERDTKFYYVMNLDVQRFEVKKSMKDEKHNCDYCKRVLTTEEWNSLISADLAYYGTICSKCWSKQ